MSDSRLVLVSIAEFLQKLSTTEDLRRVNKLLRERWHALQRSQLSKAVAGGLDEGATVIVDLGKRGKVDGTVEKVNAKTLLVKTPVGRFKCTANILTLKAPAPEPVNPGWDDLE